MSHEGAHQDDTGPTCERNDRDANIDALDDRARAVVSVLTTAAADAVRASEPGLFTAAIVGPDGVVVARCRNRVLEKCDPTAHAEIEAIREACRLRGSIALDGCVLCSNAEPCPMCLSAAYWAGIRRMYYACPKEVVAETVGFDDARLYIDLALPPAQRALMTTMRVDCPDAADAFCLWRAREASAPTGASAISPSARAHAQDIAQENQVTLSSCPPEQQA